MCAPCGVHLLDELLLILHSVGHGRSSVADGFGKDARGAPRAVLDGSAPQNFLQSLRLILNVYPCSLLDLLESGNVVGFRDEVLLQLGETGGVFCCDLFPFPGNGPSTSPRVEGAG